MIRWITIEELKNIITMLTYITIISVFLLALLDFVAYMRISRSGAKVTIRKLFAVTVLVANIIPLLLPLFMFVFNNDNNGVSMIKVSMVFITFFILLAICRFVLYIFWLPSRSKKWLYCGITASAVSFILFTYGIFVTRTNYKVNEIQLSFRNLPNSFNGYRIAFISDIHIGSMCNAERELEKLSDVISRTDADIIMFGGDMVNMHHSELTPGILERLAYIKGREATLAVLGNHDTGAYLKDSVTSTRETNKNLVEAKLEGIGWILLRDSTKYLYNCRDSIAVTGIDYTDALLEFKHKLNNINGYDVSGIYSSVDRDIFNITISHLPQLWHELCDNGYADLTLSGHIHATQLKYDIFGLSLSPAALMYDEWSGVYERKNGKLYINDGIGTVGFFARLGANPEVTVITLLSQSL